MRVPRELDEIIMHCLAAKPEERFQRPNELLKALADIRGEKHHKSEIEDILGRIRARERSGSDLCWNCRRPLPFRSHHCPHCGETS
jgi:hypothetical protein